MGENFLIALNFAKVNNAKVHFWPRPRQTGAANQTHFSKTASEFQLFAFLLDALCTPWQSLIYPTFLSLFSTVNSILQSSLLYDTKMWSEYQQYQGPLGICSMQNHGP